MNTLLRVRGDTSDKLEQMTTKNQVPSFWPGKLAANAKVLLKSLGPQNRFGWRGRVQLETHWGGEWVI